MSGSGSNHDYYYPRATPPEAESELAGGEPLPEMLQSEYLSNTFPQQNQYWPSTAPQTPAPQMMSPPCHTLPYSTQEVTQLSEAQANSSGKNLRRLLPALPPHDPRSNNTRPNIHSAQGTMALSYPETSLTLWPLHRLATQPHHNDQTTIPPQAPTLNQLRTNNAKYLSESLSPMDLSPQPGPSTHNTELLRCTWPGCRYEGTFNRPKDLERHMETQHTKKSSHECHFEDCDSTYNRKDNLTAHVRRKHSSGRS